MPRYKPGSRQSELRMGTIYGPDRRFREIETPWPFESTSFPEIDNRLNGMLSREIRHLAARAAPDKSARILDWGCGKGVSAAQIAETWPQKVLVLGFSDRSYPDWEGAHRPNLQFLHTNTAALERLLRRDPVDLIYSDSGLSHLDLDEFTDHVEKLRPGVKVGGKIMTTCQLAFLALGDEQRLDYFKGLEKKGYQLNPHQNQVLGRPFLKVLQRMR